MLKSLLSVCSIFVLLFPTLVLPGQAQACPVKLPETLLALYRNSDMIYVARFDKVEDHEILETTDNYISVKTKQYFDVSSTLKGEPSKLFVLEDTDYRYKPPTSTDESAEEDAVDDAEEVSEADEEEETDEESSFGSPTLAAGDSVLLFLRKDNEKKTVRLTDYRDGIKKMTAERLDSYEARIRELNSIFSAKKVDDAAIVDWLVRCAQDPITRWEGAFELQQSFRELAWKERREQENKESATESEEAGEDEEDEEDADEVVEADVEPAEIDRSVYAKLLTDVQKQTLMSVLIDRPSSPDPAQKLRLSLGDRVLIEVVSKWGDNRFAGYLLDRLRAAGDDPYFIHDLMSTIAGILADDELDEVVSLYSDVYYEEGSSVVEDEDSEEAEEEEADTEDDDSESAASTVESRAGDEGGTASAAVAAPKKTYNELRAELLAKFLTRSVIAIQIAEANQEARASR